ncbi:MAG: AmmeMemoRadiSam system radical SAM enzyme [Tepidanaerobacteraceae bacterium]
MKEALYYEKAANRDNAGVVYCTLCPHRCRIDVDRTGACRVRKNIGGRLYSMNYGCVSSAGMDPIEKKPLYHFYPGSYIYSIGSIGCNFRCKFCQNWQIAQIAEVPIQKVNPEDIIKNAKGKDKNIGIAYTYNEPTIWYEFIQECARLAHQNGLKNVLVTNGFIEEKPLTRLLPFIDAINIDVKSNTEDFYRKMTSGSLAPVKQTVELASEKCHLEITTLLIPGWNDEDDEIEAISKWISSIDREIPLHLTRYYPNYMLDIEPTPVDTVKRARKIAMNYLDYVYTGNIIDDEGNNTFCPDCREAVIKRGGGKVKIFMENKKCTKCGKEVPVVL